MKDALADKLPAGNDYNQMRAFIAVAEYLSFSRAAEVLGVSPSALSQTIRSFEERVGMRLLHRTTRNVSLTEVGENLVRRIRPAAFELGDALAQTRIAGERPAGTVRVHAFRSAAQKHIQPILKNFAERYPDIVLDITIDDEAVDIVAGGYDVALRIGEVIERDMVAVRLGPELRQLAIATPDYFSQYGRPEHPRDLVHHRCVRWRWPGHHAPYAWEFFEDDTWFSVAVNGPLILSDKETAVSAVLEGTGIGFAVEETVAGYLAQGRLESCLESWSAPFPGWFVCYPYQRQMAPALRAFIDAIRVVPDGGLTKDENVAR
jgi:DNA-binding transcriptional LysR family regulator